MNNYDARSVMPRVDSNSANEYKAVEHKRLKQVARDQPHLTKQDIFKHHRGDPVISKFHPLRHFGAISEKIDDQLKSYIEKESLGKKIEVQGTLAPRMRTQPV
jgi:hypothetical protein